MEFHPSMRGLLSGRVASDREVPAEFRTLLRDRLLRESTLGSLGHPLLILLVAWFAWHDLSHPVLINWVLAVVLATTARAAWLHGAPRYAVGDGAIWLGARLTIGLVGLAWGVGAAIALPRIPIDDAALILVILAGITASALTTLAADLPSFVALVGGMCVPVCVGVFAAGHDRPHLAMTGIVGVFALVMGLRSRQAHATILAELRANGLMQQARDVAELTARTRAAFLANMSHEIRTPMNAVLGFVELILDTELTTEQRRALELVRASSESLVTILNDVLDYSKIEADRLELESISFDLPKVVYGTASLLAVRAREKHLELLAEVPPDVPRLVRGDPTRVRQVLTNLIGNAIKFTDAGEVVVSAAVVEGDAARAHVRFSVSDTGIGIPPDQLRAIFEEFTQADRSMTRRYGGTGLGLSISERLVRLMGGQLEVTSEVGKGSQFVFTLEFPIELATDGAVTGQVALGGRRALVVDDNPTNRRILRDMLAPEGVAVDDAAVAPEVVEILERAAAGEGRARYDLVILDAQLPGQDGFELAAAIRRNPALGALRLLMLTSAGQRGDGERCRALGIDAYLPKPVSRVELMDALRAVFASPGDRSATDLITRHSIAESRQSLQILLVEDTVMKQQVAVAMLSKRGHRVDVASSGSEAIEAVGRVKYDVVLMDLQMPGMDGFQATRAIRALPTGASVPIVALTAHALSGQREECLAHGMTGFLTKPFKGHELFALIEGYAPPAPTTGPEAPADHAPADLEALRASLREVGAESVADALLATFLQEAPERLAALHEAVAGAEAGPIVQVAHAFLGVAKTVRAHTLADALERAELAARRGDVAAVRAGMAEVDQGARAVLAYVERDRAARGLGR